MTNIKRYVVWILGVTVVIGFVLVGAAANYARADYFGKNIRENVVTTPAFDWRDCRAGCVMKKASAISSFDAG